jgi:hypothetical protein
MHALIFASNISFGLSLFRFFAMSIRAFCFAKNIITGRLTHENVYIFMAKNNFVFTDIGGLFGTSGHYPNIVMCLYFSNMSDLKVKPILTLL